MKLKQGAILWINLDPAKGTETKKKRPCLVVSNDHYNRYFNTVLVVPISTSDKYRTLEKYVKSPLFIRDELSNQAQLFAEENFTWTFPSQDLAWTVI